jgi:hypothetical protein
MPGYDVPGRLQSVIACVSGYVPAAAGANVVTARVTTPRPDATTATKARLALRWERSCVNRSDLHPLDEIAFRSKMFGINSQPTTHRSSAHHR